jgi:hypothetical protein
MYLKCYCHQRAALTVLMLVALKVYYMVGMKVAVRVETRAE